MGYSPGRLGSAQVYAGAVRLRQGASAGPRQRRSGPCTSSRVLRCSEAESHERRRRRRRYASQAAAAARCSQQGAFASNVPRLASDHDQASRPWPRGENSGTRPLCVLAAPLPTCRLDPTEIKPRSPRHVRGWQVGNT